MVLILYHHFIPPTSVEVDRLFRKESIVRKQDDYRWCPRASVRRFFENNKRLCSHEFILSRICDAKDHKQLSFEEYEIVHTSDDCDVQIDDEDEHV